MRALIVAIGLLVAWLTRRDRNPARWPVSARDEAERVLQDAQEALVDGARAGKRAERAFDDELRDVRAEARTW